MLHDDLIKKYRAIVIGVSAGGMQALPVVLSQLPPEFPLPVIIVQHTAPTPDNSYFIDYLNSHCSLSVKEAEEKEHVVPGYVYIAPADYHLLIEKDMNLSLSVDKRVNYSRPSIDVLFESAADVFQSSLIGIILTGSNSDGSLGLKKIKELGGLSIVQDPDTAESDMMPVSAIQACKVDNVLSLEQIGAYLVRLFECYKTEDSRP